MQKENQVKGRMPDFKGSLDVAAWENTDNDGNTYISVVLGNRAKLVRVEKQSNGQALTQQEIEDIYQ